MSLDPRLINTESARGWQMIATEPQMPILADQNMKDAQEKQEEVDVSVSQTPQDIKHRFSQQIYDDYTEAARQVSVEDIDNDEKLAWLLSQLRMSKEDQDGLIAMLRKRAEEDGATEALDKWKFIVVAVWGESAELSRLEDEEVKRVQGKHSD